MVLKSLETQYLNNYMDGYYTKKDYPVLGWLVCMTSKLVMGVVAYAVWWYWTENCKQQAQLDNMGH